VPPVSLLIEGAPFVGNYVDDDNLLQMARPLDNAISPIMLRLR